MTTSKRRKKEEDEEVKEEEDEEEERDREMRKPKMAEVRYRISFPISVGSLTCTGKFAGIIAKHHGNKNDRELLAIECELIGYDDNVVVLVVLWHQHVALRDLQRVCRDVRGRHG